MNKNDCKIVQDLLPNYIDKLTNEYTNEFIERHLNECSECKKIYDKMKKQIDLNFQIDDKEIKPMKKINKKVKIMGILILILAIVVAISLYINYKSSYLFDAKTGKIYGSDIQVSNDRNVLIEYNSNYNDIDIDTTIVLTLDNNNICKNARVIETPNNDKAEESLEYKYSIINSKNSGAYSNGNFSEKLELSYNYNMWNGKSLEDILKELDEYELNVIEY